MRIYITKDYTVDALNANILFSLPTAFLYVGLISAASPGSCLSWAGLLVVMHFVSLTFRLLECPVFITTMMILEYFTCCYTDGHENNDTKTKKEDSGEINKYYMYLCNNE